jgi:hypothetical protein
MDDAKAPNLGAADSAIHLPHVNLACGRMGNKVSTELAVLSSD